MSDVNNDKKTYTEMTLEQRHRLLDITEGAVIPVVPGSGAAPASPR